MKFIIGLITADPEGTDLYDDRSDRVGITRFSAPAETILDIVKDTELQYSGKILFCSVSAIPVTQ